MQSELGGDPRGSAFDHRKNHRTSIEARLASKGDSKWSWLGGLFYTQQGERPHDLSGLHARLRPDELVPVLQRLRVQPHRAARSRPPRSGSSASTTRSLEEYAVFGELGLRLHRSLQGHGRRTLVPVRRELRTGAAAAHGLSTAARTLNKDTSSTDGRLRLQAEPELSASTAAAWCTSPTPEGFRNGGSTPVRDRSVLPSTFKPDLLDELRARRQDRMARSPAAGEHHPVLHDLGRHPDPGRGPAAGRVRARRSVNSRRRGSRAATARIAVAGARQL
mgnify:CR=1 FL=1